MGLDGELVLLIIISVIIIIVATIPNKKDEKSLEKTVKGKKLVITKKEVVEKLTPFEKIVTENNRLDSCKIMLKSNTFRGKFVSNEELIFIKEFLEDLERSLR